MNIDNNETKIHKAFGVSDERFEELQKYMSELLTQKVGLKTKSEVLETLFHITNSEEERVLIAYSFGRYDQWCVRDIPNFIAGKINPLQSNSMSWKK